MPCRRDELINVLTGTMRLVGPRRVLPYDVDRYGPWERAGG
jgi:lipopolysaccharide/colanic/teichoic acid biosynthesis glycosyltransferase